MKRTTSRSGCREQTASSRLCRSIDDAVVVRQEVLCRSRHLFVPIHHGVLCYLDVILRIGGGPWCAISSMCVGVYLILCNLQLPFRDCICVCGPSAELIDAIPGCPIGSISVGTAFAPVLRVAFVLAFALGPFFNTSLDCPHAFTPSFTCITIVI